MDRTPLPSLGLGRNSNEFSIIIAAAAANASPSVRPSDRPRADSQKQAWRRRRWRHGGAQPRSDRVTVERKKSCQINRISLLDIASLQGSA